MAALVMGALVGGGCGAKSDERGCADPKRNEAAERALLAIQSVPEIAHWDIGDSVVRQAIESLRGQTGAVRVVSACSAINECRQADIVIVGENHSEDLCRQSFGRIVRLLAGEPEELRRRTAIGLECLLPGSESSLQQALAASNRPGIQEILRDCWPFPVEQYVELLLEWHRKGYDVLALRAMGATLGLRPDPSTPDSQRRPRPSMDLDAPLEEWVKQYPHRSISNRRFADVLNAWIRCEQEARDFGSPRAIALVGAWHPTGYDGSLQDILERAGHRVVSLLVLIPRLELAIRESLGPNAGREWVRLGAGVYRAPVISDEEWLVAVENRAEREAAYDDWVRALRSERSQKRGR